MSPSLRQLASDTRLCAEATLEALSTTLPRARIESVLAVQGVTTQRERKLPMALTALTCIAMNLFIDEATDQVLERLLRAPQFLRPEDGSVPAGASAISQRRQQLGVAPMVALFRHICQPLATRDTQDAFWQGLRLMAIDGVTEDVADTPANARYFGRAHNAHAASAFPQVKGVYVCECGTHAIVDAGFWPCQVSERIGGLRLLRSVGPGDLLLWDTGLQSYDMCAGCTQRQAAFLGRVPAGPRFPVFERLPDGSFLTEIRPWQYARRRRGERLRARVLEYTFDDPPRAGHGVRHRLITSLLDPVAYPALELIRVFHERWEVEITLDETDSHQRPPRQPLRSRTPLGVLQELYGLLLAHYAVRAVMHEAALRAGLPPDRLSFTRTVRLLRVAMFDLQILPPPQRAHWYLRLLDDIARKPLPVRDNRRCNPRVVRRWHSKFPTKREAHRHVPQPTKPFAEAIVILVN
jgi:hypothetical protein